MREFWLWACIVGLLIFCIMALSFGLAHNYKQIRKAEIILQRVEQMEKKSKSQKEKEE